MSTRSEQMLETDAFDEGMRFSSAYRQRTEPEIWNLYRERYLAFRNSSFQSTVESNKIPKKLHQIWLGSELPPIYRPLIEKFKLLHPDWEYTLWTDRQVANLDFQNKPLFLESKNYGQKSDILRYEILHRFGGVYLDLDFVAVKPLNHLLKLDFFAGIAYDPAPNLLNGAIGSSPDNNFTNLLISMDSFNVNSSAMAIMDSTGPYHLSRALQQAMQTSGSGAALPNTYFYPFPNFPQDRVLGEDFNPYLGSNTYACHLWHCSWLKQKNKGLSRRVMENLARLFNKL